MDDLTIQPAELFMLIGQLYVENYKVKQLLQQKESEKTWQSSASDLASPRPSPTTEPNLEAMNGSSSSTKATRSA